MTRPEALSLINAHTTNKNLIKHMLAVETAMRAYASKFNEDIDKFGLCGLLHDVDYEKMKEKHPSEWGMQLLSENGISEDIIEAILLHGEREDPSKRTTTLSKALFAVDELTGFIVACALVRPDKIATLEVNSVEKRMKTKDFAKAVSREDIVEGAKDLGVSVQEHIQTVLDAMKSIKNELSL